VDKFILSGMHDKKKFLPWTAIAGPDEGVYMHVSKLQNLTRSVHACFSPVCICIEEQKTMIDEEEKPLES